VKSGASGCGEATVGSIVVNGGKATIIDVQDDKGRQVNKEISDQVSHIQTDVKNKAKVQNELEQTDQKQDTINNVNNCSSNGNGEKTFSGTKGPHQLGSFQKVIQVNLVGTFNVIRLAIAKMQENEPNEQDERGVIINTASVAAFEGQIGQVAYSASKGGIVGMTLPIARDVAKLGIRVMTIAPGLVDTPLFAGLPDKTRDSLGKMVPFPSRLGYPDEYATLVKS